MKNSDWAKWAAVAEILSAIAIVVTLLYLAVQTTQNTKALQAGARQAALDTDLGLIYKSMEYPIVGSATPFIEFSDSDYTEPELRQIVGWEIATLRSRENYWLQYQDGALDLATWESYRSVLIDRIQNSEHTRKVWELFIDQFDPGFAQEVNSYLPN